MELVDVAVIGAGYAGAATAWALGQQRGMAANVTPRTVILEREARAGHYASGRNAGIVRTVVADPAWGSVCARALASLRGSELADLFAPIGCILTSTDRARLEALAARAQAQGAEARYVALDTLASEWGVGEAALATLVPQALLVASDGAVNPHRLLGAMLERATAGGATLALNHAVIAMQREAHEGVEGWRVETATGVWFARAVVNAAGSWCDELLATAALPRVGYLPMKRHIMRILAPTESAPGAPPAPTSLPETRRVWWHVDAQEHYIRAASPGRFVASTCDAVATTAADYEPDPAMAAAHRAHVEHWWPWLKGAQIDSMGCLRTFAPPHADAAQGPTVVVRRMAPGFFTVGGLGGHGATIATLVGLEAAAQVLAELG